MLGSIFSFHVHVEKIIYDVHMRCYVSLLFVTPSVQNYYDVLAFLIQLISFTS
jgi:hypothetical protein